VGPRISLNSTEEKNLFLLLEIEKQYLGHPACGPSNVSTELSWFSSIHFQRCIYIGKYLFIQGPPKKCIHNLTKENSTLYNRLL